MEIQRYDEIVPLSEAMKVLDNKNIDIRHLTINCSPYCSYNQNYGVGQMEDMLEGLFEEPKAKIQELGINMSGCNITREVVTPLAHLLRLRANCLVDLDLSNTKLSSEMLEILLPTFKDSRISSLNLSFTNITEKGVEMLSNQIKLMRNINILDLRGLNDISYVKAKKIMGHLKDSHLTTLKCSCPYFIEMIDKLECFILHYTTVDFSNICCKWLRHNSITPNLKCIDLSGNMTSGDTFYYLLKSMKGNFHNLVIRFSGCHLNDRTLMKVASLENILSVEFLELYLDSNDITDRGLEALLKYLEFCKVKGNVYVRNCPVSPHEIRNIMEMFKDSSIQIISSNGLCFSLSDAKHPLTNEKPKNVSPVVTVVDTVKGRESAVLSKEIENSETKHTNTSDISERTHLNNQNGNIERNKTMKETINKKCVVLYNWSSSDKRMLSIKTGEEYIVLFLFQDWYYAVGKDGREGFIPPKYVRLAE